MRLQAPGQWVVICLHLRGGALHHEPLSADRLSEWRDSSPASSHSFSFIRLEMPTPDLGDAQSPNQAMQRTAERSDA
jgi:hypothetical protein